MRGFIVFLVGALTASMVSGPAIAQETQALKLRDIREKGAKQLSAEELRQLLPGAKTRSVSARGNTRIWVNDPDGKLIASSDNRGMANTQSSSQARGTWQLGDNGTYCVLIEWRTLTEQWCRFIFGVGDKYYGVNSATNDAGDAHELAFDR